MNGAWSTSYDQWLDHRNLIVGSRRWAKSVPPFVRKSDPKSRTIVTVSYSLDRAILHLLLSPNVEQ